ncbi:MAG: hypothetical protein MUE44_34710 [Oscillatoriaceae cyanobacterium Prado104]|jgi:hypothetical protein|nr:hypothetical protein [Oscillatoriaceae cyanobacterium Prado104]
MYLSKLAALRLQIQQLSVAIDSIMPDATIEALDIAASGTAKNGKSIVFQERETKIVLTFRKQYEESERLKRIDEDILTETVALQKKNAERLFEIDRAIEQLQLERERLLNSPYLESLKKEYNITKETLAFLSPQLAVYLPK